VNAPVQAETAGRIGTMLKEATRFMISAHLRPDGDAIGSVVGMGLALQAGGKQVQLVLQDPIPPRYRFLKGSELIHHSAKEPFDLSIALDCGDLARLGDFFKEHQPDINIDHHITNEQYSRVNLVIPEQVATSAILAEYLPKWGFPLDVDSAGALCMGLLTDTNGFRIPSVTPATLELAADLMRKGAQLPEISQKALVSQSLQTSKLWGLVLAKLQLKQGLVWTSITMQDRELAGYHGKDDAEIANFLTGVEGSQVALLFNEQGTDKVKVSWRSRNHTDVAKLAQHYNGGGHSNAAGAEIAQSLPAAESEIIKTTLQFMSGEPTFPRTGV
jgi:bifunctional oligoribonuclease and PAP phosphatase NrnA